MVKVSVIVPIYNVEEYLEECLDSLVNQTIDGLEIILVDDGSTDSCGAIAQRYADQYSNITCHHIENGGLGHARNYGVQFAHGKYVCFADSDDVIPDYAYKEMYDLGEKHGADIVVGDVVRFNSRREYSSNLHRRAFGNAREVMHITTNPDLLYDTTSWNKLFNHEFYTNNKLQWAEGIMYEDIPVTIPAHYMANKVAYLNKVVYKWRARDGVSASITQRRNEIENFRDRLTVLKMVDSFFDERVLDSELLLAKDGKWLSLDFKIYINELLNADTAYQREIVNLLADYLPRINPLAYQYIRAIDRLKYYFISQKDVKSLLDVLHFEKRGMKTLRVKYKNQRYYGDFPFAVDDISLYDMTEELQHQALRQKLYAASLDEDKDLLTIRGRMYVRVLDVKSSKDAKLSAYVVDECRNRVLSLHTELVQSGKSRSYDFSRAYKRIVRRTNKCRGYKIVANMKSLAALPDGKYYIESEYRVSHLTCDAQMLGKPVAGGVPRPYSVLIGNKAISIDYDVNYYIRITVESCQNVVSDIEIVDDDTLRISHDDGTVSIYEIPDEKDMTLDERYFNRTPVYMPYKQSVLQFVATRGGRLYVQTLTQGVFAFSCEMKEASISVQLYIPTEVNLREIESIKLVGSRFGVEIPVLFHECLQGAQRYCEVTIDLHNQEQVSKLRDDRYKIHVSGIARTGCRSEFTVYNTFKRQTKYNRILVDGYQYTAITGTTVFNVSVKRIPRKYDRSKRYNRLVARYVYPLMRLLPIKKNWIVFESYWGSKTDCNPGAMFEYMSTNHPEYTCIWSVTDPRIEISGNARCVVKKSLQYFYVMARAKYLFNNVNFIDEYEKRKGQIEVQTMHGTPLKTLGLDVPGDFPTQASIDAFLRRCGRWDYLVVQSTRVEEITRSCYAYKNKYLETGYPRNDILFRCDNADDIFALKEKYGIDPNKKLVLYAPTWRKSGKFDLQLDLSAVADSLGDEYQIGLRVHHLALAGLHQDSLDKRILNLSYVKSMEELFLISDVVVTDYSSLMFDYAILNRPLLFYVYDLEEYRDRLRGFNIDLESEAPGPLLFNTEEVIDAIRNGAVIRDQYQEAYQAFRNRYCTFETGHACEQIFDQVFKD